MGSELVKLIEHEHLPEGWGCRQTVCYVPKTWVLSVSTAKIISLLLVLDGTTSLLFFDCASFARVFKRFTSTAGFWQLELPNQIAIAARRDAFRALFPWCISVLPCCMRKWSVWPITSHVFFAYLAGDFSQVLIGELHLQRVNVLFQIFYLRCPCVVLQAICQQLIVWDIEVNKMNHEGSVCRSPECLMSLLISSQHLIIWVFSHTNWIYFACF